jgi:folate-binding protein YgfZ
MEAGLIGLPERGVLAVTGPQRANFLHNLLSNDVEGRAPGQGALAALMDARGHVLVLLRVLVGADEILLEMPRLRLAPIEALLAHYRVGAPVRFAPRPVSIRAVLGAAAENVLKAAGGPLPETAAQAHASGSLAGQAALVVRASDLPSTALVVHCAPEAAEAVDDILLKAGATALDPGDFEALRIEQGRALFGVDVTEENLLHETGLVAEYHSAAKGCYVGQEVIARLEARGGHVNKILRGLTLSAPVAAGTALAADGKEVGRVTTAARSSRLGPIAMAYVHRNHAAPGTLLDAGGPHATVAALPMA